MTLFDLIDEDPATIADPMPPYRWKRTRWQLDGEPAEVFPYNGVVVVKSMFDDIPCLFTWDVCVDDVDDIFEGEFDRERDDLYGPLTGVYDPDITF